MVRRRGISFAIVALLLCCAIPAINSCEAAAASSWPMYGCDGKQSFHSDVDVRPDQLRVVQAVRLDDRYASVMENGSLVMSTHEARYHVKSPSLSPQYSIRMDGESPFLATIGSACNDADGNTVGMFGTPDDVAVVSFAPDLKINWRVNLTGFPWSIPIQDQDGNVLVVTYFHGPNSTSVPEAHLIDKNGTLLWSHAFQDCDASDRRIRPSFDQNGSSFYLLNRSAGLVLVSLDKTGNVSWSRTLPNDSSFTSGTHVDEFGRILITASGCVHCFDKDGDLQWMTADLGFVNVVPGRGMIFASTADDMVAGMSPNGAIYWQYYTQGSLLYSPSMITSAEGALIFTDGRTCYVLNGLTGIPIKLLDVASDTSDGNFSDIIIGNDGSIYLIAHWGESVIISGPRDTTAYQLQSFLTLGGIVLSICGLVAFVLHASRSPAFSRMTRNERLLGPTPLAHEKGAWRYLDIVGILFLIASFLLPWFVFVTSVPDFYIGGEHSSLLLNNLNAHPLPLIAMIGIVLLLLSIVITLASKFGGAVAFLSILMISLGMPQFCSTAWLPIVNDLRNGLGFGWAFTIAWWGAGLVLLSGYLTLKKMDEKGFEKEVQNGVNL
ncbi:MAG: hypothetical protein A4E32_01072 [Methanomassiliicoccales archaeon PtaU1.Bin124]|nr:MAG: hypothetical protein A4E32_01072 [Methanomassiliicoccales archaeon PtaU1.Bin124]